LPPFSQAGAEAVPCLEETIAAGGGTPNVIGYCPPPKLRKGRMPRQAFILGGQEPIAGLQSASP